MPEVRPPTPGPIVQPNFLSVEEAVRHVPFPISKRDLLEQIDDETSAILAGRNVDLHEIIKDLRDDFFESEDEFREALEREYGVLPEESAEEAPPSAAERRIPAEPQQTEEQRP